VLELTDGATPSDVRDFSVGSSNGTAAALSGAGDLDVTGSLSWHDGGSMSGAGTTVLTTGAEGTVSRGAMLDGRTLRNEGTLHVASGSVDASNGALVDNRGTLRLNSVDPDGGFAGLYSVASGSSQARLRNTGAIEKTAGDGVTTVLLATENEGSVSVSRCDGAGGRRAGLGGDGRRLLRHSGARRRCNALAPAWSCGGLDRGWHGDRHGRGRP
jgi:hypothetical protein